MQDFLDCQNIIIVPNMQKTKSCAILSDDNFAEKKVSHDNYEININLTEFQLISHTEQLQARMFTALSWQSSVLTVTSIQLLWLYFVLS